MDTLSRYLYAVRNDLPKNSARDDIAAEIGEALQSQFDAREADLGRALTSDEEAAIIKAYGHPRVVASRYSVVPYLIGPELLPAYVYLLRTILTIVLAVEVIAGALIAIAYDSISMFTGALGVALRSAVIIFTIVTLAFAAAERNPRGKGTFFDRWDPRRLPAPGGREPVSRANSVIEFIVNVLMVIVLLALPHWDLVAMIKTPNLNLVAHFNTASWLPAYLCTIAGAVIIACSDVAVYIRPEMSTLYRWMRIIASTVTIIGLAMTLARPPLLLPADSAFNLLAQYSLIAAIAILGVTIAVAVVRLCLLFVRAHAQRSDRNAFRPRV